MALHPAQDAPLDSGVCELPSRQQDKGAEPMWRVLGFLGGLTFLAGGIDVLNSDCPEVLWGGTARSRTYACVENGGDISGTGAALLMLGGACLMLLFSLWPIIRFIITEVHYRRTGVDDLFGE